MNTVDPFRQARDALSRGRSRTTLPAGEKRMLERLGPDRSNQYYVDGIARGSSAIHAQALVALEAGSYSPCRLPFEVRVPRGWLLKVAATHSVTVDSMYASARRRASPVASAWFGDEPPPCQHGPACQTYLRCASAIRRHGYTRATVRELVRAADEELQTDDVDLLYRYARSIGVGAGRAGDSASADDAERLTRAWLAAVTVDTASRQVDHANLLRSVAFAQVSSRGPSTALATVREATTRLREVERDPGAADRALSFRIREALFPTLETLSLCEERWGDHASSVGAATELVERFPADSRAWIRLAKSLFAASKPTDAIESLLNGAKAEHPKWLYCVVAARLIAEKSDVPTDRIDEFASAHQIALEQLEVT